MMDTEEEILLRQRSPNNYSREDLDKVWQLVDAQRKQAAELRDQMKALLHSYFELGAIFNRAIDIINRMNVAAGLRQLPNINAFTVMKKEKP